MNYKWQALAAGGVYIGGATMERAAWPLLLPVIRRDFNIGTSEVVWLVVMFALGMAGSTLTVGHLGDRIGHRRLAVIGSTLEGLLLLIASFTPVFWPLLLLRLLQGVAAAMALNNLQALTIGAWPRDERGRILGFTSALPPIGLIAGPIIAGFVAQEAGWRWVIGGLGVFIMSEAIWARLFMREDSFPTEPVPEILRKLDWAGAAVLFGAIGCLIVAARFVASDALRPLAFVLFPCAVAGFVAVVWLEKRSGNPVLDLDLFTKRTFVVACGGMILFSLVLGANTFLFPFYLQTGLGWSVAYTGSVMVALYVLQPVGAPVSGWVSDRTGARPIQAVGIAISFIGLVLASQLGATPEVLHVVLVLMLVSLGASLFNPANNRTIYGEVPRGALGTASAISASGRYVGQAVGAALAAALLAAAGDEKVIDVFGEVMLLLGLVLVGGIAFIQFGSRAMRQPSKPVSLESDAAG